MYLAIIKHRGSYLCEYKWEVLEDTFHLITCELRASLYRLTFMNTNVNQFLIFRLIFNIYIGMLIKCCKKNDCLPAESFIVLG